jgi:hypothetical protein
MTIPSHSRNSSMARAHSWPDTSRLKHKWRTACLLLALACLAIPAVPRLLQSLGGTALSPWRLVLLFADAFFCVGVACALYARGRRPRRRMDVGRGRS